MGSFVGPGGRFLGSLAIVLISMMKKRRKQKMIGNGNEEISFSIFEERLFVKCVWLVVLSGTEVAELYRRFCACGL